MKTFIPALVLLAASKGAAYNAKANQRSWEAMKVFFAKIIK